VSIIKLENISKVYGFGNGTTIALDDINLQVKKGEFVAVMGPSGAGKSTLLNIIGLLDHPTQGFYELDEHKVSKLHANARAKNRRDKIGFVFQNCNLLPRMTVIENVALPLAYRGMTNLRRLHRASQILDKVGLQSREYYYPHQLSGGQAQKVAIARALINHPSLIIADEPTGNLDSASSAGIMKLLSDIHHGDNTIIMVTHNPELTAYASRVVYMRDGRIHQDIDLKKHEIADVAKLHNAPAIDDNEGLIIKKTPAIKKSKKSKPKKAATK
jgi:putative ABC transport system ATP-binding protein